MDAYERDEGGVGLGHAGLLPWNLICPKATVAAPGVQAKWVSRSGCRAGSCRTPSVESDLPKGYRGAAERSSEVGVPEWLQRYARRTQRETTWYQGVASSETRVERGWVMQDSFRGI